MPLSATLTPTPAHPTAPTAITRPWSERRDRLFHECRRRYYYAVHLQQGGWRPGAALPAHLAWSLGKLVPLLAAVGLAVHRRATECVDAVTAGRPLPTSDDLRAASAGELRRLYGASVRHRHAFLLAPARVPMLQEVFYHHGCRDDELAWAAARLEHAHANLVAQTALWDALRAADARDVIRMDPFYRFHLKPDGIPCYAAADLVYRPARGAPYIIVDFKTGDTDGAVDQILTYALALRDGLGLPPVDGGYAGRVIGLGGDGCDFAFPITAADLEGAAERIRQSAAAMDAAWEGAAVNARAAFPQSADRQRCRRCAYQLLCDGDWVRTPGRRT